MAWRRSPRRMANYSEDMDEEYAQENSHDENSGRSRQEKSISNKENTSNSQITKDQDILLLLEKINLQLENMRLSEQNQQKVDDSPGDAQAEPKFLQNNSPTMQAKDNKANDANTLLNQLLQKTDSKQENTQKSSADSMVLQTAAEVLSRAQYELSNELENSLKKLKEVIRDSEQIANKISSLIEQKQQ